LKKVPPVVRVVDDYLTVSKNLNTTVWGMGYVDVTDARKLIREYYEKTGHKISFTAFLITCYSRAVEKFKFPINTFHKRMKYYYIFDDIDVQTNIERTLPSGIKRPLVYTIRKANEKTLKDINDELQAAKQSKPDAVSTEKKKTYGVMKLMPKIPRFIRRLIMRYILTHPLVRKRVLGTIGMTAVGMLAKPDARSGYGHGIFITPHTCSVAVAGLENKQIIIDGKAVVREVIAITFAFDHRVIDGGPATRFGTEFIDMVEREYKDTDWCFNSLK
jgi:pyruvate/2-oxoglutarate dehydrogenase complex dihydrolipoamide acyltransferase (E2) component